MQLSYLLVIIFAVLTPFTNAISCLVGGSHTLKAVDGFKSCVKTYIFSTTIYWYDGSHEYDGSQDCLMEWNEDVENFFRSCYCDNVNFCNVQMGSEKF
ncbi:hypothetical protein CRE_21885 [Caenorhabditis remanei]|uniref:Uncharacterized protein n=1 Tax=Caenorhabditis remanei TaxID=31234 RepID=E3MUG1_CAERE|nr:hypothetical protein CRE_21885 [Caenorhabditis remanei]